MKNNKNPVGADASVRPALEKDPKNQTGITLIALVVTIIVLLILAGVALSLVAGGNGIIGKATKAVDATTESTAVEEVELVIAEANMEYYLDDTVTNETIAEYLAKKFSPYTTGSGAEITFSADGSIQYEVSNGAVILLEMQENGKVEVTKKADGTKIQRIVTYNANGGTGSVPPTQNVERNATVNVDFSILPTREEYQFLGWATSNNATSVQYTQSGTTSFVIGASNVTLYAVWGMPAVTAISSANYGDDVNYTANGVSDWKVFLNDGTNIYLIASTYVPNSGLNLGKDLGIATKGSYCVYRPAAGDYTQPGRDMFVSWLNTSSYWSKYAEGFDGATATGGPTYEQFWASYNKKYGTNHSEENINISNESGCADTLYFAPGQLDGYCYWLASPNSSNGCWIGRVVGDGRVDYENFWSDYVCARPLVCLPAGVTAIKGNDRKWTFTK